MIRRIIHIDQDKCNGCGACAKACHEGAIDMVDGKARLMREHYCDGLGDCLPACPTGAITFEIALPIIMGIAIGAGTDVAISSADVVLMKSRLSDVPAAIRLSRACLRNIHENLFWAFLYNVIGIPVAAGVLYPFTGWLLSPMIAGLAMALSSVCLVLNANRLHGANINVGAADGPAGSGSSTADVESAGSAESANAANITGSATSNAPHEPTVIIDDRTTLNQTNHVSDQSNNPTNKENTMDTGMHMHHTAPADGETATDPVCGMTVAVNADAITREYEGKSYYFCGEH